MQRQPDVGGLKRDRLADGSVTCDRHCAARADVIGSAHAETGRRTAEVSLPGPRLPRAREPASPQQHEISRAHIDALMLGASGQVAALNGGPGFEPINPEPPRSYSPRAFYQQSKFANVLFGLELDRRVRAAEIGVRSVLAHPGYSDTNLQSSGPTGLGRQLMKVGNRLVAQSAGMGALPQLYAAVDPGAQSGLFYGPSGFLELRGYPVEVQPVAAAKNEETARHLWEVSEQLTGVTWKL